MILRSIRWRLQAWHAVLLTMVVTGFGLTTHRLAVSSRLRQVDDELQSHVAQLGIAVPPTQTSEPPGRRPPPRPVNAATDQITGSGAWFIVWNTDGSVQITSSNAPALTKPAHTGASEASLLRTRGEAREALRFTGSGRCFLVGRTIRAELKELTQLGWYLAAACAGVLVLGLIVGMWLTTRALRPLTDISTTAERIAAGDLSQRIPTAGSSEELERLTEVLNHTFGRLDAAFTQQQRFTADAAHELRTPVSVILTHAENGLASTELSGEQRESFDACRRAARRMRSMIESLLQLARLDAGEELQKRDEIDLADLVRDAVELVQPLAERRGITLHMEVASMPLKADAGRLMQVIVNLLTNAIQHHHHDRGCVRLRLEAVDGQACLSITDDGPGIPEEHLPHVFDRFYRAEASRGSQNEHSGLGLAISKAIVEGHHGSLDARSEVGHGSTFTLRLPRA